MHPRCTFDAVHRRTLDERSVHTRCSFDAPLMTLDDPRCTLDDLSTASKELPYVVDATMLMSARCTEFSAASMELP